jgi:FAD/FMN-containing dehydrogenase
MIGRTPRVRLTPPRDRAGNFVNWSRTVTSRPASWHGPTSEAEIVTLVREAATAHRRVRVVGAGHSWSEIAAPDDIAVSLDRWTGVTGEGDGTVTVRAGTRLRELNAALAARGLAMPILGSIAQQSVAGAIATGTHGSSLVHGNLSSLVVGARLVTGTGDVLEVGDGDERLDGLRVHLGALGAISHVTVRVVPAYRLAETVEQVPVEQVAGQLEEIGHSAEYVKVWWLPHTPYAVVLRYERTDDPTSRRPSAATGRWFDERVMHRVVLPAVFAAHNRRPGTIPPWNRTAVRTLVKPRRVGPSELMLSTPNPARHYETEAALPLARAGEAFDRVVRVIDTAGVQVNFIAELRYVRGDSGWLSPAYGGDVVQLGAYTAVTSQRDRYFGEFWRAMRPLGARPHWGKQLDHEAGEIRTAFPMAPRFAALRDELDPGRVFANPFLTRVLGA